MNLSTVNRVHADTEVPTSCKQVIVTYLLSEAVLAINSSVSRTPCTQGVLVYKGLVVKGLTQCQINANRGGEARGNYLPEAPYLRETKTYLNYIHASESTLDSGTASHSSRHDMLAIISSRYQYGPFLFFVAEVMSNYLTTDGLKKFLYFRSPPP